jgi:hypothetical protein
VGESCIVFATKAFASYLLSQNHSMWLIDTQNFLPSEWAFAKRRKIEVLQNCEAIL